MSKYNVSIQIAVTTDIIIKLSEYLPARIWMEDTLYSAQLGMNVEKQLRKRLSERCQPHSVHQELDL